MTKGKASLYLSKSRFKIASECPVKLYYGQNRDKYPDSKSEDDFLKALADGGFQVGALAQCEEPDGVLVSELDPRKAVDETTKLLEKEKITIFEAALEWEGCLIRVDILVKDGNRILLKEVKAKSTDSSIDLEDRKIYMKREFKKGIHIPMSTWEPYFFDVAFQTLVARRAHPEWQVSPYLVLADKGARATVDELNQRFRVIEKDRGRKEILFSGGKPTKAELGERLLLDLEVREAVDHILKTYAGEKIFPGNKEGRSFEDSVKALVKQYQKGERPKSKTGHSHCKACEYRVDPQDYGKGLVSGFKECFSAFLKKTDLDKPLTFDIWFGKEKWFPELLAENLSEEDFDGKRGPRQQYQWEVLTGRTKTTLYEKEFLQSAIESWDYPLHFIDFETSRVAIPFSKGRRPYEQHAFQFSHHLMHDDGRVEHVGEYLHTKRGEFPNFKFIRALKAELEKDNGTVFRYADHENTVLCEIHAQLDSSDESDKEELMAFIATIATRSTGQGSKRQIVWGGGPRNMVDLKDLVQEHFLHPLMGGSNSLKKVLPATLAESKFLQERYGAAIYGTPDFPSKNFKKKKWILSEGGKITDPYDQLGPVFGSHERDRATVMLVWGEELREGGAAMTAWAKMQFSEMTKDEKDALAAALLRYCELDTLAMVMLVEHWKFELNNNSRKKAA